MNLGNALDAPAEGGWGVVLEARHFELIARAGFDHVRLPVRFSAHAADAAPYAVVESFFARVDWAIDQALARKLGVIVDFHYYDELMKQPEVHAERFLGLWTQIAARYRERPKSVAFELLNEPNGALDVPHWNALAARALGVVRASNPERTVIVDSASWAAANRLAALELPPGDANLVASFHCYQPILFTHQGADWMGPEYQTLGVTFPGPPPVPVTPVPAARSVEWVRRWFDGYLTLPADRNPGGPHTVLGEFEHAERFIERTGVRLYLGELGAIDHADLASRARYVRFVREEAERHGIGWAYWDDGGRFRAFDVKQGNWVPELYEALRR